VEVYELRVRDKNEIEKLRQILNPSIFQHYVSSFGFFSESNDSNNTVNIAWCKENAKVLKTKICGTKKICFRGKSFKFTKKTDFLAWVKINRDIRIEWDKNYNYNYYPR
jgi:hypothetical protein